MSFLSQQIAPDFLPRLLAGMAINFEIALIAIAVGLVLGLVLAFLRVPLAFALLSVSLGGISVVMGWDVARSLVPLTISEAVFSYELAVVPMFILMGNILARTGISDDLFSASNAFLGPVRGGLALSTMVTCAGFSAVCGSSLATAATMSKLDTSSPSVSAQNR